MTTTRKESKVSQEKLKLLVDNWMDKSIPELAEMLEITETTLGFWVMKLRKSMKAFGMTPEQIAEKLPSKRRAAASVFDMFVKSLADESEPARTKKHGGPKKKKNEG